MDGGLRRGIILLLLSVLVGAYPRDVAKAQLMLRPQGGVRWTPAREMRRLIRGEVGACGVRLSFVSVFLNESKEAAEGRLLLFLPAGFQLEGCSLELSEASRAQLQTWGVDASEQGQYMSSVGVVVKPRSRLKVSVELAAVMERGWRGGRTVGFFVPWRSLFPVSSPVERVRWRFDVWDEREPLCLSHALPFVRVRRRLWRMEARMRRWLPTADGAFLLVHDRTVVLSSGGGGMAVLHRLPPPPPRSSPRRIVLMLDKSGSMRRGGLKRLLEGISAWVSGMMSKRGRSGAAAESTIDLVTYDLVPRSVWYAPEPPSRRLLESLEKLASTIRPGGGTNLRDAFDFVARRLMSQKRLPRESPPLVVLFCDGRADVGSIGARTLYSAVREAFAGMEGGVEICVAALGEDVDHPLFASLVRSTGGGFLRLPRKSFTSAEVAAFLRRHSVGEPGEWRFEGRGRVASLRPAAIPYWYGGGWIVLTCPDGAGGSGLVVHCCFRRRSDGERLRREVRWFEPGSPDPRMSRSVASMLRLRALEPVVAGVCAPFCSSPAERACSEAASFPGLFRMIFGTGVLPHSLYDCTRPAAEMMEILERIEARAVCLPLSVSPGVSPGALRKEAAAATGVFPAAWP